VDYRRHIAVHITVVSAALKVHKHKRFALSQLTLLTDLWPRRTAPQVLCENLFYRVVNSTRADFPTLEVP
jgi:hypothetical protein